jgi:hypothetical protein
MSRWKPTRRQENGKTFWIVLAPDSTAVTGRSEDRRLVYASKKAPPLRFESRREASAWAEETSAGEHPTKRLRYRGKMVRIDIEMVPIIRAIWALGLETRMCCQHHTGFPRFGEEPPGWRMVCMPVKDATRFMRIAFPTHLDEPMYDEKLRMKVDFSCYFTDDFEICIAFPKRSDAKILKALRAARRV